MIVTFKSEGLTFYKERKGVKPNTFRKIDEADERFKFLRKGWAKQIQIIGKSTNTSFLRDIKDVTEYEGYMIISWEHKDGK